MGLPARIYLSSANYTGDKKIQKYINELFLILI
jgi:hypothetical protein